MNYPAYRAPLLPNAFIWRRIHSLTGLWLVIFLMEHLFTNSQAALFIGDDGSGFVRSVNFLRNLPYLPVIEFIFLAIPFAIHGIWGIQYLREAKYNSSSSDGSTPSLPEYPRNHAYTWQRWTSWFILIGIVLHVVQMRFIEYPSVVTLGSEQFFINRVKSDEGIHSLSKRVGAQVYNQDSLVSIKNDEGKQHWIPALEKWPIQKNELVIISPSFGVAVLLMVRDTFKSPTMIFLYTIFVLASCFHAFNGLWTAMITWGITLTARSQLIMRRIAVGLMILTTLMGLAAIWGSYWFAKASL